ncbi:hypothetical protein [Longimicrobium sp.]|uniref:hypothetical protein n=1 Tax=Longimicrobium sp. TaxID=2029185 RepID=UPI002BD2F85C|nr:hypothetical protein [Longimicrobium sp.]HSU17628.1 hypothetical protein [Longimicrobium sp.]
MPLLDPVFPTEAALPACARDLLAALYPTVRWDRVSFHAALPPWLLRFTDIAITLPDPLTLRHIRIFVAKEKWDPRSMAWLGTLVHESFHVLQYQETLGGIGLGPLRIFPVKYLGAALLMGEGGAKKNRYEKPAYEHEELFLKSAKGLSICGEGGGLDRAALAELLRRNPGLVKRTTRG